MSAPAELPIAQPFLFVPVFMERVWGGRRLAELYGKQLPPDKRIGESWEIVDRPEAQSVVREGPWLGRTLHELWQKHRDEVFGQVPDAERFPLLVKLLDARERLSLQVHPPADVAAQLGGEPKTEFWYVLEADPDAEIFVGVKKNTSRAEIEQALARGTVEKHVCRRRTRVGDTMLLPSGRMHAIGSGLVILEVQQNSDTTYRVFDWNREETDGRRRELHVMQSLQAINFDDEEPRLLEPVGESLVRHALFEIEKWELATQRDIAAPGRCAIIACLSGQIHCAGVSIRAGEFFLVPARLNDRILQPAAASTSLLRVTLPVSERSSAAR
jgi:mannose-6-phosphate isomerase